MRIVLGIPIYNESFFIDQSVVGMVEMGFDKIVYLDDGSTDDSYDKLLAYSKIYDQVEVFKTDRNSIRSKSENRWKILAELCRTFEPDWIMVRAADQVFSKASKDILRKRLEEIFIEGKFITVAFPVVHLWRSPHWLRSDGIWGHSAYNDVSDSCWRNDSGWEFVAEYSVARMHGGGHRPNKFSVEYKVIGVNAPFREKGDIPLPISVLHYGMASNDLLSNKLDFQMSTANLIGGGIGLPTTGRVPAVSEWNAFNGYKVAYEFNIRFSKVHQGWFDVKIPEDLSEPKIESLEPIIRKYNEERANEYKRLYEKCFGGK